MGKLIQTKNKNPYKDILRSKFVVPPFSVLDTRQGYWQERRRMWLRHTQDLTQTRDDDYGKTFHIKKEGLEKQTSTFDPVLAEIMYRWFCVPHGKILDPFGGEQTKGLVAGVLGYRYTGIEIRQEQVDVNNGVTSGFEDVTYACGDAHDLDKCVTGKYDMCFTSPPYFDLEVYSNKKNDLSANSYRYFMNGMETVFEKCYKYLNDDTFLVLKIGEIRDKKTGEYRGFVPDMINAMVRIGFKYYNEIILVNSVGSAGMRAAGNMKSRKVVKLHQNILVFYKGSMKHITNKYKELGGGQN